MAARVARNSSVYRLSVVAWAWSRVRTSYAATFITAVPTPSIHPEVALATYTSWADELEPAAFCGLRLIGPGRGGCQRQLGVDAGWRDGRGERGGAGRPEPALVPGCGAEEIQ